MMTNESTESEDDLRRIIEVLQNQVESMQSEIDNVKSSMKGAEPTPESGARGPEPEKEPEPETREEVIVYMKKLPGIGLSKANALYEEGFDSTERLKSATEDDFVKVKGIGPSQAKSLTESIEKLEAGTLEARTAEEPEATSGEPGGGPMDFIKGTASKIFGFFKGKKPEPESGARGPEPESVPEPEPTTEPEAESEGDVKDGEEPVDVTEGEVPKDDKKEEEITEEKTPEPETEPEPEPEPTTEPEPTPEPEPEKEPEPEVGIEVGGGETPGLEESVVVTSDAPPAPTMEETIQAYLELPGIGESTATRLYEAGYETIDELKDAEEDDLKFIEGISDKTAEAIVKALKSM
jgi:ERCC4-type nuclease